MLSFHKWVSTAFIISSDKERDIVESMINDANFPQTVQKKVLLKYLKSISADKETIASFEFYYGKYIEEITARS